jgi:hypothetical protein
MPQGQLTSVELLSLRAKVTSESSLCCFFARFFAFGSSVYTACSFGLSPTSQQYFSLRTNQPPTTSQQYFSLRTNQHQPSATSQTNMLLDSKPGNEAKEKTKQQ